MKHISTLLFSLLITLPATLTAQITINKANLPEEGVSVYVANLEKPTIDLGSASAQAQNWDFSDLVADSRDSIHYLSTGQTGLNVSADLALNLDIVVSGIEAKDSYIFFTEESNGIFSKTIVANLLGDTVFLESTDQELVYPFPMEYGSTFYDEARYSGALGANSIVRESTKNMEIDAFGTLTLPGDTTFEVIRLKEEISNTDVISYNGIPVTESSEEMRYHFFTNSTGIQHPLFFVNINKFGDIDYVSWIAFPSDTLGGNSSIADNLIKSDAKFYPNPANHELNITIPSLEDNYTVEVYNFIGQQIIREAIVATSTSINTSSLQQGIYFVNVVNPDGHTVVSEKVQVMH